MRGSRKGPTPPAMQAWLDGASDDWIPTYPFDSNDVKNEVRLELLSEQRGLCVYCGRRLKLDRPGETYHVEHFRPRSHYLDLATDFSNLFLSCGQKDDRGAPAPTCGNYKDDWFDEASHVPPHYPHCTARFRFNLNGFVASAQDGDSSAENMIGRLHLNHPELVKDREDVLMMLDGEQLDTTDFFLEDDETAQSYAHVAFQRVGLSIP